MFIIKKKLPTFFGITQLHLLVGCQEREMVQNFAPLKFD
jgi:hypothetical protein